jgi:polysaccharide export outer membrane protein
MVKGIHFMREQGTRTGWGLVTVLLAALLAGCGSAPEEAGINPPNPFFTTAGSTTDSASLDPVEDLSVIRHGDMIAVTFSDIGNDNSMRETQQRVPGDGHIMLPYNIRVLAAGRTTSRLQEEIRKAYVPKLFVNLTAVVTVGERAYYVGGEVKNPTRQEYLGQMTVLRAIETASGFTDFANKKKIELRRESGQRLTVNWHKARKDSRLDPVVYPNDHIYVHRRGF